MDGLTADVVDDVNREAGGDKVKLQSSGLPLAKDPSAAGTPGPITYFSLSRGDNPGEVDGHCHSVEFARQYQSRLFVGDIPTGPFVTGPAFLKSKFEWTGLQSGSRV